jgi:hypothetical protein
VRGGFLEDREAKSLVEAARGVIDLENLQAQRNTARGGLVEQRTNQGGPDTAIAEPGGEFDVREKDFVRRALNVKQAGIAAPDRDDAQLGRSESGVEARALRVVVPCAPGLRNVGAICLALECEQPVAVGVSDGAKGKIREARRGSRNGVKVQRESFSREAPGGREGEVKF